jgi:hypothetical protein
MALGDNAISPLYKPGGTLTGHATAAITGGRFVSVSAAPASGPALNTATDGSNVKITTTGAGAKADGVAGYDAAAAADKIPFHLDGVVPVTAGGTVTAGQEVESDAQGRAITLASGKACGKAFTSATVGNPVYVRLY